MKKFLKILMLCALTLPFLGCGNAFAVIVPEQLIKKLPDELPLALEADEIGFDEMNNIAEAKGHAVLRYQNLVMRADKIVLQPKENIIRAYTVEGKKVTVVQNDPVTLTSSTLIGDYLEYNIDEMYGFIDNPVGDGPAPLGRCYIDGEQMQVISSDQAHEQKWIHKKYIRSVPPESPVVKWNNASYTTCPQDEPHYHLTSKKITMVPGKYIILHTPKVYVGTKYLFTSPFNYVVNQNRDNRVRVMVLPNYEDEKGMGLEGKATVRWDTGILTLGAAYWSESIFEYTARVDQQITNWMSLYVGDNHHYDTDLEDTKSRPFWGAYFSYEGWNMEVGWAEREKRSIVRKPGQATYDTTLWRDPEIELTTPWVTLTIGDFAQYARLKGTWGRFQETGTNRNTYDGGFIDRYGWGFDYYTDYPFKIGAWTVSPFLKGDYWNYGYKNDSSDRQIISIGTIGYRAHCGIFEMGTAFRQKRVSGKSAFGNGWDKNEDTDTIYQRFGFQIGPNWNFAVQGIFDVTNHEDREWTSMGYILTYDNHDCTKWILTVNDDMTDDNDEDWVTLSLAITAFPDAHFEFGDDSLDNPFGRPGDLKPHTSGYVPTVMERDGTMADEERVSRMPKFDI